MDVCSPVITQTEQRLRKVMISEERDTVLLVWIKRERERKSEWDSEFELKYILTCYPTVLNCVVDISISNSGIYLFMV